MKREPNTATLKQDLQRLQTMIRGIRHGSFAHTQMQQKIDELQGRIAFRENQRGGAYMGYTRYGDYTL